MSYRKLDQIDIDNLIENGCSSGDWQTIHVTDNFSTKNIKNVSFSGEIFLGNFDNEFELYPGVVKQYGIYDSTVHNCSIANNVYIKNVKLLMNCDVKENVILVNNEKIAVSGESSFGNGVEIEVLNEGGGRELTIYDKLTSQIAYILVAYRHSKKLTTNLINIINKYVDSCKSDKGLISENVRIENCNQVKNIKIGPFAKLNSVLDLQNGSVGSTKEAPVTIGEGVIAKNFIIQSGSVVDSAAILHNCFVGQSVQIGKQFSAENSAFFANCEGFHGEACSIFAGPYTVTHHKSTLLIAAMYSFYNAGSGTNQSNHMYKLGPVHQGIMERGAKTGSFSYMLWPSRIGAFSVVVGKHYSNFDTSLLPFSYIVETGGKSVISPAMNLFTVGTRRDSQKWQNRDKRKDSVKYDLIHFDLFNPYTIGKVYKGMEVLKSLYEKADKKQDFVMYNGINIKRLMLKTCRNYYEMAIKIFIGNIIVNRLNNFGNALHFEQLYKELTNTNVTFEEWVDLSGLLCPKSIINVLISKIENNEINETDEINNHILEIFNTYDEYSLSWTIGLIEKIFSIKISEFTTEHLKIILNDWLINSTKLNNMILNDASKEFDSKSQIGFGIDGDNNIQIKDFTNVRGKFEDNTFVKEIQNENLKITETANKLLDKLNLID